MKIPENEENKSKMYICGAIKKILGGIEGGFLNRGIAFRMLIFWFTFLGNNEPIKYIYM